MKITSASTHPKDINQVILGDHQVSIAEFVAVARYGAKVSFSPSYCDRVNHSRSLIEKFLNENRIIYGVTTGFGSNVTEIISTEDAEALQRNIVRSHAVSVGDPLEKEVVRAIQLMMLIHLGRGYSGVRLELLELIASLLNQGVTPFAPGDGSVGYLAPEAHMALVLIGEGKAWHMEELLPGREALERAGLTPTTLSCKEGLALTNGSSSVTAMAILTLFNAIQAVKTADIAGAMSFEALKGTIHAFDPRLHALKQHEEQAKTAQNLLRILKDSEIAETYKNYRVQDALSLRCIPQVHGASKRNLKDAAYTIHNELNSVSDNPVIVLEEDDGVALMGGNFDGTYVGIQADIMCIAMGNLGKIAERRIDRLVNFHLSEMPSYLVRNPGLNNGYMIPQYTAVGLLGEIRILSHPASVESVPTSANQEDVVSFAYAASKKAYQISKKLSYMLAIELMTAVQALDFHRPMKSSPVIEQVYNLIRTQVPTVEEDRFFYPDIVTIYHQIHEGDIVKVVEDMIGEIE
ncbi:histidine ammonia-lyase [Paenibacillus alginolyticus]|uniref:histidine ammonia-lyase n=1 Tax=Paenibacillus alginolyticus TaxID=59839 RepID=UPI000409F3AB|nr:histidine ammonia-lyase [Paenibacillus alginolyticus]MCY9667163.1 histidine ammonia-lyase [Paenibacillus alginolyticus]